MERTERFEKLLGAAKNRRTTKNYNETMNIDESIIDKIHEFTNTSPSSVGLEQWRVLSISRGTLKDEILEHFLDFNQNVVKGASHIAIFVSKKGEYYNIENKELVESYLKNLKEIMKTFKKEVNIAEAKEKLASYLSLDHAHNNYNYTEWSVRQAYIGLAYMLLASEFIGVKTTSMEGFSISINEFLSNKGLIDKHEHVSITVALGYTDGVKIPFFASKQYRKDLKDKFKKYK